MHALGKFFLFLVAVGSIGAFFMTTRTFEIRNAWMKQAASLEKDAVNNQTALDKSIRDLEVVKTDFESTVRPWRGYWTAIKVAMQPGAEAQGGLLIQLGLPQLKQPEDAANPLLLHAFQSIPGSTEPAYVGEFKVEQLGEGQSVLMPNWLIRPTELQQWVVGDNWHFREAIPAGDQSLIGGLEAQLAVGLERLLSRQAELAQTESIIERTQGILARRVGEIEGIPNADEMKEKLPVEFVAGYLQTIQDEESAVNAVTAEVQQLRDELYDVQQRIDELRKEIESEFRRLESLDSQVQASLTPTE